VRYLIVAVALGLTCCSGVSNLVASLHPSPTDASCASRGMTLDANIKQCVVPPPSPSTDTTGSLPPQAKPVAQSPQPTPTQQTVAPPKPPPQQMTVELQQPPSQEKRTSIPIEPAAGIQPDSQISDVAVEFAHFVRGSGYRCDSISALTRRAATFTLTCNRSTFRYAINKDKDGGWVVALQ
jgi:hypothetical protein